MRTSEEGSPFFYNSLKRSDERESETVVQFLLQSEELLSDERASEDRSLFFITV